MGEQPPRSEGNRVGLWRGVHFRSRKRTPGRCMNLFISKYDHCVFKSALKNFLFVMRTLTPTRTLSIDTGQEQAMITVYATLMQN